MEEVIVRYIPLPHRVKGLTVMDENGDYNIYINARLSYETNLNTLQHEIRHIKNNDFSKSHYITEVEERFSVFRVNVGQEAFAK